MNAQIYADGYQANVYQAHTEPWNYLFHGTVPRTFDAYGVGLHTMPMGADISFLWYWTSITNTGSGGYRMVNCSFMPPDEPWCP